VSRRAECQTRISGNSPEIDGNPSQVASIFCSYYRLRVSVHSAVRAKPHSGSIAAQTSVVAICIAFLSATAVVWVRRAHQSERPSLNDVSAWQWVATSPGTNIFMNELPDQHSANHVRAWVAFRFFSSPVSVNADVIDLWDFDCLQHLSRRVSGSFRGSPSSEIARRAEGIAVSPRGDGGQEIIPDRIFSRICPTNKN
jgi:hypothetical protein